MKIAYNLLVVLDVDEEDSPSAEVRELAAQCRLAAGWIVDNGAPHPGDAERLSGPATLPGAESVGRSTVVYLSAVEL